jgi:hypothetical protein
MTEEQWGYFLLGLAGYLLLKLLVQAINHAIIEYRQKRFLKLVHVLIPGKGKITFIAISTSDKRVMDKLERQLREKYDLIEDEDEDSFRDRGRPGDLRLQNPRNREDPPR